MLKNKETTKDNREKILRGFEEIKNCKLKIIFLLPFIICAIALLIKYINMEHTILKNVSETLYPLIKTIIDIFIENSSFNIESLCLILEIFICVGIFTLEFIILLLIVSFIGMTPSSNNIQNKIEKIKFTDGLKPIYKGQKKDKNKKHGRKLIFECEGLIKDDYINNTLKIESALRKYKIYKVEQDKLDKAIMYLYSIKNKYVKPMLISSNTNFLDIVHINLLLTRRNWNGKIDGIAYYYASLFKYI